MGKVFEKLPNGQYAYCREKKKWNPLYKESLLKYINALAPLYDKAKQISEFEFIFTLLQIRELSDPGYSPYDNTIEIFKEVFKIQSKIKNPDKRLNLAFWAYAHWIEASEPYEMIANLLNIIDGGRFLHTNFPKKQSGKFEREQYPHEKITHLTAIAAKVQLESALIPIKEVYNRELRNSIFHSDYSIYNQEIRTYRNFTREETYGIINKTLAYFEASRFLFINAISEYENSKKIQIPHYFEHEGFANTMSRKGYGLIGIKDSNTSEELAKGKMSWHIARLKGYELRMLPKDKTRTQFPEDKIMRFNKVLKFTPRLIKKLFKNQIKKYARYLT